MRSVQKIMRLMGKWVKTDIFAKIVQVLSFQSFYFKTKLIPFAKTFPETVFCLY